jgi:O-methyltransferase
MTETYRSPSHRIAPPYLDDTVVCSRNPVVQALKPALSSLRAALPDAIYEPLYQALFSFYKGALRMSYSRNVVSRWLAGDRAGLLRAKSVYRVMPASLVGASGLEATFDAASELVQNGIPGDFVECGVARGGCAALMATVAATDSRGRRMWLFDSFEGLPSPTSDDYGSDQTSTGKHIRPLVRGSCLGTKDQVEALLFSRFGFSKDSISLIQGWFQDTLPSYRERIGQIALLRIDGDWYESTMCCLDNLYDNVTLGGCIIIDDYGVCFGCKKAVHEFFPQAKHPSGLDSGQSRRRPVFKRLLGLGWARTHDTRGSVHETHGRCAGIFGGAAGALAAFSGGCRSGPAGLKGTRFL